MLRVRAYSQSALPKVLAIWEDTEEFFVEAERMMSIGANSKEVEEFHAFVSGFWWGVRNAATHAYDYAPEVTVVSYHTLSGEVMLMRMFPGTSGFPDVVYE